jgi:hypothetical protein
MQCAELDASAWIKAEEVCDAIYEALGSQYNSCNINALMEGLYWDHAYDDLNGTAYCETYNASERPLSVMAALVAAIHFPEAIGPCSWMAGTSPAMTGV